MIFILQMVDLQAKKLQKGDAILWSWMIPIGQSYDFYSFWGLCFITSIEKSSLLLFWKRFVAWWRHFLRKYHHFSVAFKTADNSIALWNSKQDKCTPRRSSDQAWRQREWFVLAMEWNQNRLDSFKWMYLKDYLLLMCSFNHNSRFKWPINLTQIKAEDLRLILGVQSVHWQALIESKSEFSYCYTFAWDGEKSFKLCIIFFFVSRAHIVNYTNCPKL